jgi:hypothetical protein
MRAAEARAGCFWRADQAAKRADGDRLGRACEPVEGGKTASGR